MRKNTLFAARTISQLALAAIVSGLLVPTARAADRPSILFTDVDAGPVTGGPNNLGVPISIFGKGFGATRGASRVTIGGVEVASYLVWGAKNAHNQNLDMVVVQPGPNAAIGPIVVTVNGQASNPDHSFRATAGAIHYIAASGADSNPCTSSAPCQTILHVSTVMRPGDAVLVRGGTYAEGEIWIRSGGLSGQPKIIKNYPGEEVYLSNASRGVIVDADYVTVSGFNLQNGKSLDAVGWASRNQRGDRFINNTFIGTIAWGAVETQGHDHVLAGNVCQVSGSSVGTQGHCFYISAGTNLRILYNIAAGAPGYGIHMFDQRRATPDFRRIISNILVEGNILRNSTERSGMIMAMWDEGSYGNYIDNITIRNNIFTANNYAGLTMSGIVRNVKVYNNVFYQNGRQAIQIDGATTVSGIDIRNNLLYQSANSNCKVDCSSFPLVHVDVGTSARSVVVNNNSYHPAAPVINGASDSSAVTGTVQFANAGTLDFHPLAGSVVIDRGMLLTAVPTDFDGRPRPQDAGYDIGAFEFPAQSSDTTAPTVVVTSPAAGAAVSSTVNIAASASDSVGVAGVQFFVDGVAAGAEDTVAPYQVSWNTIQAVSGTHSITARARDAAGNRTTSSPVSVVVNNTAPTADTTAPTVSIISPLAGSTTAGSTTVAASASDAIGVAGVQFYLDGAPLGAEDTAAPYSVAWNTTHTSDGTHALTARARDAAGNYRSSSSVQVTVMNTTTPTASCARSSTGWTNVAFGQRTGPFMIEFDAVPNAANIDAFTWLSNGPATGYANMAVALRFNPSGSIDVRDAGAYRADVALPYSAGKAYHFTLNVDITTHRYSVDVTPAGGTKVRLAANYAFRTEQNTVTALDNLGYKADTGTHDVCGVKLGGTDTSSPAVQMTAPAGGSTVSGIIAVFSANASDNTGVAGVQFLVDGRAIGTEDTTAPFTVQWTTTGVTNGTHTLTARARDAAGNQTTSAAVSVTVSNSTTMTVSVTAPAAGTVVSGTTTVSASTTGTVAGVQFLLDGAALGAEDTIAPYALQWNTTGVTNGAHLLSARARDASGTVRTSTAVSVTVNNVPATPAVSITAPASGTTVSGTVAVSATTSTSVAGVQFLVDGTAIGAEDTSAPYSVQWNTTSIANGSHALTARARTSTGSLVTSAPVTVTVGNSVADTIRPSVPGNVSATAVSASQIDVSWTASTDNIGVAGYRVYRNGTRVSTASPTSFSDTGLTPSTAYTYTVDAYDAAGNASAQSAAVIATTQSGASGSGAPALFFSDLDWGPKTGWEGSTTRGAAVSIWGKNLGSTRGTSYVTVNGSRLITATDYSEWGVTGPARGLERITFWIPSTATDGTGNISVTVNGQTSNSLPFTVMAGKIYFIAPNGNNANNGSYSTATGGANGPWRDIYMFNPGTDSSSPSTNPSGDGQYIVYVRGGTYSTLDADEAFIALRGPYGGPTKRKALIGYPGETAVLNTLNANRGVVWNANYSPYGMNSYFTFAKMQAVGGTTGVDSYGNYNRVVGMTFRDMLSEAWSGVVMVDNSQHTSVYGNMFDHNGFDSYKHNIYIKTHSYAGSAEHTDVAWNEFANAYARDTHGGVIFVSKEGGISTKYTRYVYIHDNYFHDGNMEFIYTGDNTPLSDIYIYNNVFRGGSAIGGNGIFLAWDTNSVYLYNNVFYQMGGNGQAMVGLTGVTHAFFKNNIWVPRTGQPMLNIETYQGGTFASDSDLFFGTAPSGAGISVTNPVTGDPRFINAAGNDFRLQSTSPAINRGTSAVSSVVSKDYNGVARPQGSAIDIGAFEYLP